MTSNQLSYQRNVETTRHNLVTEAQGWVQLEETHRHNVVGEQLGYLNYKETARHNRATEAVSWADLQERIRHNTVTEGFTRFDLSLKTATLAETMRHNTVTEREAARHNKKQEYLIARADRARYPMYILGDGEFDSDFTRSMMLMNASNSIWKGMDWKAFGIAAASTTGIYAWNSGVTAQKKRAQRNWSAPGDIEEAFRTVLG